MNPLTLQTKMPASIPQFSLPFQDERKTASTSWIQTNHLGSIGKEKASNHTFLNTAKTVAKYALILTIAAAIYSFALNQGRFEGSNACELEGIKGDLAKLKIELQATEKAHERAIRNQEKNEMIAAMFVVFGPILNILFLSSR